MSMKQKSISQPAVERTTNLQQGQQTTVRPKRRILNVLLIILIVLLAAALLFINLRPLGGGSSNPYVLADRPSSSPEAVLDRFIDGLNGDNLAAVLGLYGSEHYVEHYNPKADILNNQMLDFLSWRFSPPGLMRQSTELSLQSAFCYEILDMLLSLNLEQSELRSNHLNYKAADIEGRLKQVHDLYRLDPNKKLKLLRKDEVKTHQTPEETEQYLKSLSNVVKIDALKSFAFLCGYGDDFYWGTMTCFEMDGQWFIFGSNFPVNGQQDLGRGLKKIQQADYEEILHKLFNK